MTEIDEFDGAVFSDERPHILDGDCWCGPQVIEVPPPVDTKTRYHRVRVGTHDRH